MYGCAQAAGVGLLTKTDAVDARMLASYGAQGDELLAWVPPPVEVRVLRALVARLDAVAQDLQREENRLEKAQSTDTPQVVSDSLQRSLSALSVSACVRRLTTITISIRASSRSASGSRRFPGWGMLRPIACCAISSGMLSTMPAKRQPVRV